MHCATPSSSMVCKRLRSGFYSTRCRIDFCAVLRSKKPMTKLTVRQREVLDFIRDNQQSMGHSPTLREICAHFGFASPKAAADHLTALERKGYLEKRARLAR